MQEINLTNTQLRILLNMTEDPGTWRDEKTADLVSAVHSVGIRGHGWYTQMSAEEVGTALELLIENQQNVRTTAAQQAVSFFVRGSVIAQRLFAERRTAPDVPRETSPEES